MIFSIHYCTRGLMYSPRSTLLARLPCYGMTNYPIGPHRTPSTNPHSTSYFLPPTTGQSFILSLACILQTRSIIDIQEKLLISTQLRRITFKAYLLLVSKVCADCAEEIRHVVSSYEQKRPALSALNYRVNCRRSTLSRLDSVQLTLPSAVNSLQDQLNF